MWINWTRSALECPVQLYVWTRKKKSRTHPEGESISPRSASCSSPGLNRYRYCKLYWLHRHPEVTNDANFSTEVLNSNKFRRLAVTGVQWWVRESHILDLAFPFPPNPNADHTNSQCFHRGASCSSNKPWTHVVGRWLCSLLIIWPLHVQFALTTTFFGPLRTKLNHQHCAIAIVSANCFVSAWLEMCRHVIIPAWISRLPILTCVWKPEHHNVEVCRYQHS